MKLEDLERRRATAVAEFDRCHQDGDGERVADSLANGLTVLCNQLFTRVHEDVEREFGFDSMLMPASTLKSQATTKTEIELFQVAVSAVEVREHNYVDAPDDWYVEWLGALRLGDSLEDEDLRRRLFDYLQKDDDQRRLMFSRNLQHVFPEAVKAPLILFRLFPLAVRIVTSIAFGDHLAAAETRNQQMSWQSAISDCHECHGRVLDNDERCQQCGNPLWSYDWLTAVG